MPNDHFIAKLVPGGGPDPAAELQHIVDQAGDAPDGTAWFATRMGQGLSPTPDSLCILFYVDRANGGVEALAARLRRRQDQMPDDLAVQELHQGQGPFPLWWQVTNPRRIHLPSLEAIPGRSGEGRRASETFSGTATFAYWSFDDLAGEGDLFTRLVNCLQPGESVETATAQPQSAEEAAGGRVPNKAAEANAGQEGIDAAKAAVASRPTPKGEKSPKGLVLRQALPGALTAEPTLCVGLDFAWWGGGPDARSQTDTLFFATVQGEQAGPLQMRRVLLRTAYDPDAADTAANCDPDAALVLAAVEEAIVQHGGTGRLVMAVDAPLRALDRPHLPPRNRKAAKGMEYRQCEQAARAGQQQDAGSGGWKHIWNIQPGAPLCPRVAALVAGLQRLNFELYTTPTTPVGQRVLFECFPGEALWTLGVAAASTTASRARPRSTRRSGGPILGCGDGPLKVHGGPGPKSWAGCAGESTDSALRKCLARSRASTAG